MRSIIQIIVISTFVSQLIGMVLGRFSISGSLVNRNIIPHKTPINVLRLWTLMTKNSVNGTHQLKYVAQWMAKWSVYFVFNSKWCMSSDCLLNAVCKYILCSGISVFGVTMFCIRCILWFVIIMCNYVTKISILSCANSGPPWC